MPAPEKKPEPTPEELELADKVQKLVAEKFEGDYQRAFNFYDTDTLTADGKIKTGPDGKINKEELKRLLSEAHVGNMVTRGTWADQIIEKLDKDHDKCISWQEFQAIMTPK